MKATKKLISLVLAVLMLLTLTNVAFAAESGKGSITISNATAGKDYTAYKIFDAVIDGNDHVTYTYNGTVAWDNDSGYFYKDAAGFITATEDATDDDGYLTDEAISFLATLKGDAVETIEASSDTVVFDDLDYGYYYIETTNGAAVTIDSAIPDAVVYDKNQTTDFEKTVITGYKTNGDPILAETNTVSIGDKVTYQIKIDATNYNGKNYITNYYVYDTMDEALTFNGDLVVSVNGTALQSSKYTFVTGEDAAPYNFEINIPWVDSDGKFLYNTTNSTILVVYSATVNEKVKTAGPMKNTAEYNFNELPTPPEGPEEKFIDPDPDKPKRETESYSTELKVCKVDEDGDPLSGAKFSISGDSYKASIISEYIFAEVGTATGTHYMLKDGTYTTDDPILEDYVDSDDGVTVKATKDLYDSLDKKYALIETITKDTDVSKFVAEAWVDDGGILTFTGLGEGDYLITELVAPNGYNILPNPILVSIVFDTETKEFTASYIEQGFIGKASQAAVSNGTISFNVVNKAGVELPATGGMGTTLLIVLGSVLFLATGIVLVAKKRLYNEG